MSETTAKKPKPELSQATRLVKLAFEQRPLLFCDADQTAYVEFQAPAGHREVHPLRSWAGRTWLSGLYFIEANTAPGAQAIADAQNVLEAYALKGGVRSVAVRLTRVGDDAIYLDLADARWRVVEITRDGWRVLTQSPVPFRRPRGLAALPEPSRGGSLATLWRFLTVTPGTPDRLSPDQILTAAWLLGVFRGRGPYSILVSCGPSEVGKSTTQQILRSLVDPSVAPLRSAPRNEHDLMIAAHNTHILTFDNLSSLKLSDEFCRLASGTGFATRTLYENREEEIFCGARPIAVNGIVEIVERPDLISRCVFVQHQPLRPHQRLSEDQLWQRFHLARPLLLGALLDIVVVALRNEPAIRTDDLPRMADFARFVLAAEPACPWPTGRFVEVYGANRDGAIEDVLGDDPVAVCVRRLVREHPAGWSGTATEFLVALNASTPERLTKAKEWYSSARSVANALRRLISPFRQRGICITFDSKNHASGRHIHLERVEAAASIGSVGSVEADLWADLADASADATDASPDAADGRGSPSSAAYSNVYADLHDADATDDGRASDSQWESDD